MSRILRHPSILQKETTAVVVIDMQAPFVNAVCDTSVLIDNVADLAAGLNLLKVPIIGTTQYASRMGDIIPEIRRALPPTPAHDKMVFDCCGSASFLEALEKTGATQVLLCGVETHICVCQTAHGLLARGYQVHVVTDAVSSRNEANYRLGIDKMSASGVLQTSVEMALYELMYEAAGPVFKEILAIIK